MQRRSPCERGRELRNLLRPHLQRRHFPERRWLQPAPGNFPHNILTPGPNGRKDLSPTFFVGEVVVVGCVCVCVWGGGSQTPCTQNLSEIVRSDYCTLLTSIWYCCCPGPLCLHLHVQVKDSIGRGLGKSCCCCWLNSSEVPTSCPLDVPRNRAVQLFQQWQPQEELAFLVGKILWIK